MSLRFAILKTLSKGSEGVALEYDEQQLADRLVRRVRENLLMEDKLFKRWSSSEIDGAVAKSFFELVTEFKEETVKIS